MAYTRGRCTNQDYCSLAAGRQDIEVRLGEDFICPECAKPLRPPPTRQSGGATNLAIAGGAAALLLTGGGIYAGYRMSAASAGSARTAALSTPAAAAPATPAAASPAPAALAAAAPALAAPSVLLRVATPPALARSLAAGLATAYLTALGDTEIAVQPAGPTGELRVTGQRLSRPETIALLPTAPADGGQGRFAGLASGQADVVLAGGRVTGAELEQFRSLGDLAGSASEHKVGQQAEAVIVSQQNPTRQLSMPQLQGILDGSITSWRALGVSGPPIHLLTETDGPKPADLVTGLPERTAAMAQVGDAAAAIAADPAGLALVPVARTGGARVLAIASLGGRPALPVAAAVRDGTYPLSQRVFLYTPAGSKNPFAQRFATFAMSAEGQQAVQQAGLVPNTLAAPADSAPATPKDRYKALVKGATRLSAALHFEPNSNKLDLPSSTSVDRIWNLMESDHTPADHLILLGFADNQGEAQANTTLAKQRAEAVAGVFSRRGLPPGQVVSFGSDLPIADNATEEGRQKNRRVEVFLMP